MDDGGGFPTINYVPIEHGDGGNILQGLMQLYGAYKGYKQDKAGDAYLKAHPPADGVTDQGALKQWMQAMTGNNTVADSSMRNAEADKARSDVAWQGDASARDWQKTQQEGDYQKGILTNDNTRTADTAAYDKGMLENDRIRTQDQADNSRLARSQQMQEQDDKLAAAKGVLGEKTTTQQQLSKDRLINHFQQRMNSGTPLTASEQANYDALIQGEMEGAGVHPATTPAAPSSGRSAIADASFGAQGATKPSGPTQDDVNVVGGTPDPSLLNPQPDWLDQAKAALSHTLGSTVPPATPPAYDQGQAPAVNIDADQLPQNQGAPQAPVQGVPPPTPEQLDALTQLVGHIHKKLSMGGVRPVPPQTAPGTNPDDWQASGPGGIAQSYGATQ